MGSNPAIPTMMKLISCMSCIPTKFLIFAPIVSAVLAYFAVNAFMDLGGLPALEVPSTTSAKAKIFVEAARTQIGVVVGYDTSYFSNGDVPEDRGTCADVIWRALLPLDYDLRAKLEEDLKSHPNVYPSNPPQDSNINFRRVKMLRVFLDKYAQKLTTDVIPNNIENLTEWQGGDIVTFDELKTSHLEHIAIVSDRRTSTGVPLLIHNYGEGTQENDFLLTWPSQINGHYRLF